VSVSSIFGPIVSGGDVEQWCLEVLEKWSGTYLAELERIHGLTAGELQRPRRFLVGQTLDKWPEDQVPAVVLVSAGLAEPPKRRGDGTYDARWLMGLGCVCSARTEEKTHALAQIQLAAHRQILLQRPSLEGRAAGMTWLDDDYAQLPYDDNRSLGAAMAFFTVQVNGVGQTGAGPVTPADPLSPDTDPWPAWPEVDTVQIDVKKEDLA